ncbi:hypothetical protein M5689_007980 [Euphorbia peplus]|nr:hypothetical protein M5689_007980 [Euphorbia peplus]
MVKPTIKSIFFITFIVLSCVLILAEGNKEGAKICIKDEKFQGICRIDGAAQQCANDFIKKFGADSHPQDCTCTTIASPMQIGIMGWKRCTCQMNCSK